MTTVTAHDLATRLQQLLDAVAADLTGAGRRDLVERLKDEVERPRGAAPGVVVAGEAKRGKSSLINGLLGRPGLSPVGVDITTGVRIVLHHAPRDTARVRLLGSEEEQPIGVAEVVRWASVDENPGNRAGVDTVLIGLDVAVLRGVTLVDTPGVGGLQAGHAELTLQSLGAADALLFVVDAGAPLTAGELAFLERAAERIDTVLIAITKVDLFPGWATIAADNAQALAEHAPRFAGCPTLAVSSALAERAATLGEPELRTESGMDALEEALSAYVARRAGLLRTANVVRFAHSALAAVERTRAEQAAAALGDDGVGAALAAEEQRLAALQRQRADWPRKLDTGLRKITLDRTDELSRGMRELRLRYDGLVANMKVAQIDALPSQLMDDTGALAARVAEHAADGIRDLVGSLLDGIDGDPAIAVTADALTSAELASGVRLDRPEARGLTRVDHLSTLISFSSGRSLGALAASLPIVAGAGIPLAIAGLAAGGVFAWKMGSGRKELAAQTDFRNWMREQLAEAERQLANDFSRDLIELQTQLRDELQTYIERRYAEVAGALQTQRAAAAAGEQERQRDAEQARGQLDRTTRLRDACAAMLTELESARA